MSNLQETSSILNNSKHWREHADARARRLAPNN